MGSYQSESRYSLHVQLTGIEPPIWREMVVPGAISLHTLHKMLQVVMGWENTHLYVFRLSINEKTTVYGLPDRDWERAGMRIRDSRRTKLDATVWAEWLKLTYEYDLGDCWLHQITIERIEHLADNTVNEDDLWVTPRCLAGARACPPEDAGGVGGYALLLEALQSPRHPEHLHLRQWAGPSYDPELLRGPAGQFSTGQSRVSVALKTPCLAAFQRARIVFPEPILGIATECWIEFINEAVFPSCEQAPIMFTRGHSCVKNGHRFLKEKTV